MSNNALVTDNLKLALVVEIHAWRLLYGKNLNAKYRVKMEEIQTFIEEYEKRLSRPIKDLEDVREAMGALARIREDHIKIDMTLGPIEVGHFCLL